MRMWNELLWEMCYWVYVFERSPEVETGFEKVHAWLSVVTYSNREQHVTCAALLVLILYL